jgi:hypothetical protein
VKGWDSDGLWLKAKMLIDKANEHDHSSPEFAFWSALALECVARAALTKIHPVLNADPRDDTNLLYGCGFPVTAQPRSLPLHSVYIRLEKTVPKFGKTQRELCDFVSLLRNQHLHTSELPYNNLKISKWLPRYYEVLNILNESLGKTLEAFLGKEVSAAAHKHIRALAEGVKKATKDKIAAHAKIYANKDAAEQKMLIDASAIAAKTSFYPPSTTAECPACKGNGILSGDLIKELEPVYSEETLLVDEIYLVNGFKCFSCGLILSGLEEVAHAELEPQFKRTRSTSLHELYEPEHYREYDNM